MPRPFPRLCATCRERAVQPVTLPAYSTNVDHDGRSYEINLTEVSGTQCGNCAALILDDSVSNRIDDQLRALAGLLTPTNIKSHRKALNLTQKVLAQKLQIGEATLCRWETGAQIQQRSMDLLLRLFFDLTEVRQFVGVNPSKAEHANAVDGQKTLAEVGHSHVLTHWEQSKLSAIDHHLVRSGSPWAAEARKQLKSKKKQPVHTRVLPTTTESKFRLVG